MNSVNDAAPETNADIEGSSEERNAEIERLKGCINDLVSVLSLPAIWSRASPSQVIEILLDTLVSLVHLDFAYADLTELSGILPPRRIRFAGPGGSTVPAQEFEQMFQGWLKDQPRPMRVRVRLSGGEDTVSITAVRLGLHGEFGWLVAGSHRTDFPTETEKLLLDVASNEAVIGLQDSRRSHEQERIAVELEKKVLQRTQEIAAANQELRREIDERKRAEEELRRNKAYLHEAERLSHVGTWAYDVVQRVPRYWSAERFRISGFAPAERPPPLEREIGTHPPEDWSKLMKTVEEAIRRKSGFETDSTLILPDGTTKFLRIVGHPVLDQSGNVVELVGATMDVTPAKSAQNALKKALDDLQAERDRLHLLLEINKCLVANHNLHDLLKALASNLRRVTECDFIGLALPDPDCGLRQFYVDFGQYQGLITEGMAIPLAGSASGKAFRTRQLVYLDGSGNKQGNPDIYGAPAGEKFYRVLLKEGIPSGYFVPLAHRGEVIAVLQLTKFASMPLKPQAAEFLNALAVQLAAAVANALEHRAVLASRDKLVQEQIYLREEIDRSSMFEEIVGTSTPLKSVLSRVAKVAQTDSTVLITGETGTGKELIARAIHKRSARAAEPFVSVNCAAIPISLIGAELFGHEKGAFTGAMQRRLGRFELAKGGTLFLDEVGELPAETQVALLRVLQDREFERIGGTQAIQADVRLIAATNRDLKVAISNGSFRADLFYRLNVFPIELPALRTRRDDIPLLTEYFIQRFAEKMGKKISGMSRETLDRLQSYRWPGNIRELQNVVERSMILCENDTFTVDESWLTPKQAETEPAKESLSRRLATDETALIEAALAECHGRVSGPSGAAVRLGMPASTLESKIRVLKINKHRFKSV